MLVGLSQSIPRVLADAPESSAPIDSAGTPASGLGNLLPTAPEVQTSMVDLEPEIRVSTTPAGGRPWTAIDLVASIAAVRLHLYDREATTEANLKDHGIARFALNDVSFRSKSMSDGASEAQLVLRSFTMSNTCPGGSRFREIIPAADHERNQFMVLYTSSGTSALVIMTVDAPHIIFSVEPIFSLLSFFTSGPSTLKISDKNNERETIRDPSTLSTTDLRLELHDVSISVLEDDTDLHSQAIRLRINQILMSQQVSIAPSNYRRNTDWAQGVMALSVNRLGMSLIRMGAESDTVRFLDDVDLTFSLDSRASRQEQLVSIGSSSTGIVFRASYRDIMLITTIATKAIELYARSQGDRLADEKQSSNAQTRTVPPASSVVAARRTPAKAHVVMSKEQVRILQRTHQ